MPYGEQHLDSGQQADCWLGKWVKPDADAGELQPFVAESSAGCFLFICRRWMRAVAPTSHWHGRVTEFLLNAEAQGIALRKTGLPPHWDTHPLWTGDAVPFAR